MFFVFVVVFGLSDELHSMWARSAENDAPHILNS